MERRGLWVGKELRQRVAVRQMLTNTPLTPAVLTRWWDDPPRRRHKRLKLARNIARSRAVMQLLPRALPTAFSTGASLATERVDNETRTAN